jgi:hypothetical protein
MSHLRHRLGLKGFVGVSSNGQSGGLALFWHDQIIVEVKDTNERYIDVYMLFLPLHLNGILLVSMVSLE